MQNPVGLLVNAQSDAGSFNSSAIWARQWVTASFMAYFSEATASGTIQLQFSNDNPKGNALPSSDFTPVNWMSVPGSTATATITAGASGVVYPPVNFVAQWYRIVFTRTGGAGTFSVSYNALFV
jgi:hypothetical protein